MEKTFCQNSARLGYSFILERHYIYVYTLYLHKKTFVLSLSKIDTLNFTMYILKILTWSFKNIRHLIA